MYRPFFRFFNADPGAAGGGTAVIDRGDFLPGDSPADAAAADTTVADDPAAKALEGEIAADDAPAADDAATEDKPKKGGIIPLERHQAVLDKERAKNAALAAELQALKERSTIKAGAEATTADLTKLESEVATMEEQYAQLLTDGQTKEATAVMAKIRAAERQMADTRAELKIQVATQNAVETSRYEVALGRVEAAYPVLNPDHESYDPKMEARVARLSQANVAGGMTQTAALQDAVETILGAATAAQEKATTVTPRVPSKDVAAERKAAAVVKTAAAVAATPPSLNKVGLASDKDGGGKLDASAVMRMSQEQFAKLPEAALAELRGDTIA